MAGIMPYQTTNKKPEIYVIHVTIGCNVQKRTNWFVFVATSFEILQPECFEEDKQNENIERRGHGKKRNSINNQKNWKIFETTIEKELVFQNCYKT